MASSSFTDSISSLGWSRRDPDLPVNTSQQSGLLSSLRSLNPFGGGGYVQLPTTESAGAPLPAPTRREEEEGWLARKSQTLFLVSIPFPPCPPSYSSFNKAICCDSRDPCRWTCVHLHVVLASHVNTNYHPFHTRPLLLLRSTWPPAFSSSSK